MSSDKKKIFIGNQELDDAILELFMNLSLEYISEGDPADFDFHLYGDENEQKSITFKNEADIRNFIKNKGRALINPGFANNTLAQILIDRFFEGVGSIDPAAALVDFMNESFTLKVTNPMNVGYYQDLITENAILEGFNFVAIRNYLNSVLNFCSYLKHGELGEVPFDVDYGYSDDSYFMQISLNVQNLLLDNILHSFQDSDVNNPYYSAIKTAYENSHFMDMFTIEKGSKLCFCSIWKKDINQESEFFPSLLVHNLYTKAELLADRGLASKINLVQENLEDEKIEYPGVGATNLIEVPKPISNNNAVLIKLVTQYLDQARVDGGEHLHTFTQKHYDKYIGGYPDQESLPRLTQIDINTIVECLNNEKAHKSLNKEVEAIKETIEEDVYANKILEKLDDLEDEAREFVPQDEEQYVEVVGQKRNMHEEWDAASFNDLEEKDRVLVPGQGGDEGEEVEKVSGSFDDLDENDKVTVSGSVEDIGDNAQRVTGSFDDLDKNDKVTVTGSVEDIGDNAQRVTGAFDDLAKNNKVTVGGSVEDIGDDAQRVTGSFDELANNDKVNIGGTSQDIGKDAQRVKGSKYGLGNEDKTVVSGSSEDLANNDKFVVSGGEAEKEKKAVQKILGGNTSQNKKEKKSSQENYVIQGGSDSEQDQQTVWRIKGMKASSKIKEEMKVLRTSGESTSAKDIDKCVEEVVKKEFANDEKGAKWFFENVLDKATDDVITEKAQKEKEERANSAETGEEGGVPTGEGETTVSPEQEQQNSLFDNIQVDLDFELPDDDGVDQRKVEMMENSMKMRDQQLGQMKKLIDRMKKVVEKEKAVTAEIKNVVGTGVDGNKMREYIQQATSLKSKVGQIENELSITASQLKQEQRSKDIMIRNFEREKALLMDKIKEYEGDGEESGVSVATIKAKNEILVKQVDELKKKIQVVMDNSKQSKGGVSSSEYHRVKNELNAKANLLSNASSEKKKIIDMSKALAFKLRAAEQRIKSYNEKIEKIQRDSRSGDKSTPDGKSAHRVKHLEKTNERLQALNRKSGEELAEKKTELHKAKLDNKTLTAKVKELERKLGKKAS